MKVLQINNHHFIKGGADRVYFNTGRLLQQHGHEVLYFSSKNAKNVASTYSDAFVPINDNRNNNFLQQIGGVKNYILNKTAYENLNQLLEKNKPDIAHLHLFYGGLSGSILKALKEHKVPIVETVHDYRLLCPANAFLNAKNEICEKCRNRSYYQCATGKCLDNNFFYSSILSMEAYNRKYFTNPLDYVDHFIFVSEFSKFKHFDFNKGYKTKASHLYNFTTIPKDFSITDKGKYFLFFGRLSKEKGLYTLVNAAIKNNCVLKIAGGGPLEAEIIEFAKNNKNIEYLGHQSGEALAALIKQASYVVVPSEWYENNPMTVLEAYALGKPIIGAKIGGIPEIVIDHKTGFLFESRNEDDLSRTMLKAATIDEKNYAEMSLNARQFAETHFGEEAHYTKLMDIYSGILNNA
jgi:glycosyltransferase involved in cell wall biosynthesis